MGNYPPPATLSFCNEKSNVYISRSKQHIPKNSVSPNSLQSFITMKDENCFANTSHKGWERRTFIGSISPSKSALNIQNIFQADRISMSEQKQHFNHAKRIVGLLLWFRFNDKGII